MYADVEYAILEHPGPNPSWLSSGLPLVPVGRTVIAGRDAVQVRGEPARDTGRTIHWQRGAVHFDLLVDAERGTLLRLGFIRSVEEFADHAVTEIEYDLAISDAMFEYTPPPGTAVKTTWPGQAVGAIV